MIGIREDIAAIIGAVFVIMSFDPNQIRSEPWPAGIVHEARNLGRVASFDAREYGRTDVFLTDLKAVGKDIT